MDKHLTKPSGSQARATTGTPAASLGPWVARAACATTDPEIFFPNGQEPDAEAKQHCARCPVRDHCLDYALAAGEESGVWGGLNEGERRAILAKAKRERAARSVGGAA